MLESNQNKKPREQVNYNEVVGITHDDEIYICNYVFRDTMHDKLFCGATGSVLVPVSQEYIDDRNDPDYLSEELGCLWQENVAAGNTEVGLAEWIDELLSELHYGEEYFFGHDTSDVHYVSDEIKERYFPEAVTFECIGGGRCFNIDRLEFKIVLRPDILEEIIKVESES